ncbi:hypothetical protein CFE70_003285 [Pyrenophora teres f. teres 0-1]|uniref:Cytochrome P450 3A4 n=1 Tax=Pyrenophora teres f. teres (strain 0-1) TaxID=861557 RepID=E3REB5_PYRTT|nr:hypothetical protein PTT_04262 [Pyrenophora teres f. teres 0-1]KAK1913279.1 hypothetical protein P3342_005215 [Pyrenophora teres f. teres]CAA9959842.1 Cytochrome P450 3A4 [Pyrenophora teres f. maculata]
MLEFNLINCVFLPSVEAILAFNFLPCVFPAANTLTTYLVLFTLINNSGLVFYKLVLYPFFLSPLRHLPKVKGFRPLIGHGWMMMARPSGEPHLQAIKAQPNAPLLLARGFFHVAWLFPATPEALADVLVHKSYDYEKPLHTRNFLSRFIGFGLLMAEGEEHKHSRKNIMPAFSFRHIKDLYRVFWDKSIEFRDVVRRAVDAEPDKIVDLCRFTTQVTLDIIGLAGLGRDIGSLRNSEDELVKNFKEMVEPTREKALFLVLHVIFPAWFISKLPWGLNKRVEITTGIVRRITTEFVREIKANMKVQGPEKQPSHDILSMMIRSNSFSDENLVDQLLTLLAAGHETTSSALAWASYLLSRHPAVQTRLRAEIHEYIPDPKLLSDHNYDIAGLLESMPYLNGVCNEVLRLFPTIPLTPRVAIRDTIIADQFVPVGTTVFLLPWAINRNPALWGADAEEFVPDRWIDKETGRATMNGGAASNYSFLTFLHGPRSCIGERFARAEMRAIVAAFVGSFEMEMADPGEKIVVGGSVTSKPVNGMRLRLKLVEWAS